MQVGGVGEPRAMRRVNDVLDVMFSTTGHPLKIGKDNARVERGRCIAATVPAVLIIHPPHPHAAHLPEHGRGSLAACDFTP